jgi:hypothetical protein
MAFVATMATKNSVAHRGDRTLLAPLGGGAEAGAGAMLVACRLAGLSALEAYYAGAGVDRPRNGGHREAVAELASARSAQRRGRSRRETKGGSLIWAAAASAFAPRQGR